METPASTNVRQAREHLAQAARLLTEELIQTKPGLIYSDRASHAAREVIGAIRAVDALSIPPFLGCASSTGATLRT